MTRSKWHTIASLCFIVGAMFGLVPLVQCVVLDHRNGFIAWIVGDRSGEWGWGIPAIVLACSVICIVVCGWLGDRARS